MKLDPAEWRDIPGYGGMYQANIEGNIRRVWPDGKTRILKPCARSQGKEKSSTMWVVNVYCSDGKRHLRTVGRMVAETFLGTPPTDSFVCHKNGMTSDNAVYNLIYIEKREFWCKIGKMSHHTRQVIKIDRAGEIVEVYKSAKIAAEENYISYCNMLWRCSGGPKLGPVGDGFDYAYEGDAASIKAAKHRLGYVPMYKRRKNDSKDAGRGNA